VFVGFKYILIILVLLVSTNLLLPLLVFTWDVLQNPGCITLRVEDVSYISEEELKAKISASYCSSVLLKNVKITIGSKVFEFNYITKGVSVGEVMLIKSDLEEGIREIEMSIAGIYRVALRFK